MCIYCDVKPNKNGVDIIVCKSNSCTDTTLAHTDRDNKHTGLYGRGAAIFRDYCTQDGARMISTGFFGLGGQEKLYCKHLPSHYKK